MRILLPLLLLGACNRPSDDYPVHLHGQGTELDMVMPAPTPMGGRIELARFRLWGSNLGLGITGLFGDSPRADGGEFVTANAEFGYPRDLAYDRSSALLNAGPPLVSSADACFTRAYTGDFLSISEYVDVGDHIDLVGPTGGRVHLQRDPTAHPRPAGESFYAGYGQSLKPVVTGHPELPDTWASATSWGIETPGTLQPPDATIGAIPYPLQGASLATPPDLRRVRINGSPVRAPHHDYLDNGLYEADYEDDVRFAGPWTSDLELTWAPAEAPHPITLTLRYLGNADEGACDCDTDCGAGFTCSASGRCLSDEGATGVPLGELTCTLHDDGRFVLTADRLEQLDRYITHPAGAILLISRMTESTVDVPDVLSVTGKRVSISPVRTRAIDTIVTRLEAP